MEVFDKSDMLDRLGGDEELCKEIVELFIKDTPKQITELKKALENKDASIVQRQAHSLKGASANASAISLKEVAFQIETAGEKGNLDIATSLLSKIEEEFKKFKNLFSTSETFTESKSLSKGKKGKLRILIAEDDFVSHRLLYQLLSPYGDCSIANDGKKAIEACKKAIENGRQYDLICLDIMMPAIDGQGVLKEIRRLEKEEGIKRTDGAKIIMTTALNDKDTVIQAIQSFCDAYLVKPIKKTILLEKLQSLGLVEEGIL